MTMATKPPKKTKPAKKHAQKQQDYDGNDKLTRFKPGNKWWEARSSAGRKPLFNDPAVLYEKCLEYFQWNIDNPLYEERVFCHQGEVTRVNIAKPRITTIQALCIFLDISHDTWERYRSNPDFSGVVSRVDEMIWQNKLELAAGDFLNTNIVCREMGLRDKTEHDHRHDHKFDMIKIKFVGADEK